MLPSLFDRGATRTAEKKSKPYGPHRSFLDAYAAAADVTDHMPADTFLMALWEIPSGTLSGTRATLKTRGYGFQSVLVPGINGTKERVYRVTARPAPILPEPKPEPAPAPEPAPVAAEGNSVLRDIAKGLAGLDPDDLAALRDLILGANRNGNGHANGK